MSAIKTTRAVAIRMNRLRLEPIDLDFTLIRIFKVSYDLPAESNRLGIQAQNFRLCNAPFVMQKFSFFEYCRRKILSELAEVEHARPLFWDVLEVAPAASRGFVLQIFYYQCNQK